MAGSHIYSVDDKLKFFLQVIYRALRPPKRYDDKQLSPHCADPPMTHHKIFATSVTGKALPLQLRLLSGLGLTRLYHMP